MKSVVQIRHLRYSQRIWSNLFHPSAYMLIKRRKWNVNCFLILDFAFSLSDQVLQAYSSSFQLVAQWSGGFRVHTPHLWVLGFGLKELSHVTKFNPIFPPIISVCYQGVCTESIHRAEWVADPFAPKFYSLIHNNIRPNLAEFCYVWTVLKIGQMVNRWPLYGWCPHLRNPGSATTVHY